jgi:hypothetical protein
MKVMLLGWWNQKAILKSGQSLKIVSARTFSSKTIPKILFFDIPGKAGRYFGDLNAEETNSEYLNFKNRFFTDFVLIRKSQFVEI